MRNKAYRVFSLALWLSVLIVIFLLSQQDGTDSSASSGFVQRLFEAVFSCPVNEGFLREGAHFTEYLVLGAFSVNIGYAYRKYLQPFAALCFGALYALSDEIHQIFISGRACQFFDWAVDIGGVLCGVLLFTLCAVPLIRRNRRKQKLC